MHWRVSERREFSYDITRERGLLDSQSSTLYRVAALDQAPYERVVVADASVWSIYGTQVTRYLESCGIHAVPVILAPGETNKEIDQVLRVVDVCASRDALRRRTPILALGGGVVLDIAGFAASIYRRGVPVVRIPTTLVAMIDAAVGVKTAVNRLNRKSLIGTYAAPAAVAVDSEFLETLDEREMRAGFAESLKIGLVRDAELFAFLEREAAALSDPTRRQPLLDELLDRSISAMHDELVGNLWEDRLERGGDFGHTFGPAIEMAALPRLSHGDSVAIDIALSLAISSKRRLIPEERARRILSVMQLLHLPIFDEILTIELLMKGLQGTEAHRDGLQRAPLLTDLGQVTFVNDIAKGDVVNALDALGRGMLG